MRDRREAERAKKGWCRWRVATERGRDNSFSGKRTGGEEGVVMGHFRDSMEGGRGRGRSCLVSITFSPGRPRDRELRCAKSPREAEAVGTPTSLDNSHE